MPSSYRVSELAIFLQITGGLLVQLSLLLILTILIDCRRAVTVPAGAAASQLARDSAAGPPAENSETLASKPFITESGGIIEHPREDPPTNCLPSDFQSTKNLKTAASTEVALFYVGQYNFLFIAVNSLYNTELFGKLISYTSEKFIQTDFYKDNKITEDSSGLVKVTKTDEKVTLNLDGMQPYYSNSEQSI